MDNWCIPTGAQNPNAAYAWINYNLDPEVSLETLSWVGYHTAVAGIEPAAEEAGHRTARHGVLHAGTGRHDGCRRSQRQPESRVEIFNKMKAAAVWLAVTLTTEPPGRQTLGADSARAESDPGASVGRGYRSGHWRRPPGFGLCSSLLAPVALIFYYSLGYKPGIFGTVATDKLSFDRYVEAFNPNYMPIFRNTLQISIIGTFLCLIVLCRSRTGLRSRSNPSGVGCCLVWCLVPFWTNFLVRTIGWQIILAPDGFLSGFLQDIKLLGSPLGIDKTRWAVQIGVVYNYLPLMILPLFVAFDRLDSTLREASKDLYAGGGQRSGR